MANEAARRHRSQKRSRTGSSYLACPEDLPNFEVETVLPLAQSPACLPRVPAPQLSRHIAESLEPWCIQLDVWPGIDR